MKAALQRTAWVTNLQQEQLMLAKNTNTKKHRSYQARYGDRSKDAKPKLAEKSVLPLFCLKQAGCQVTLECHCIEIYDQSAGKTTGKINK